MNRNNLKEDLSIVNKGTNALHHFKTIIYHFRPVKLIHIQRIKTVIGFNEIVQWVEFLPCMQLTWIRSLTGHMLITIRSNYWVQTRNYPWGKTKPNQNKNITKNESIQHWCGYEERTPFSHLVRVLTGPTFMKNSTDTSQRTRNWASF